LLGALICRLEKGPASLQGGSQRNGRQHSA